MILRQKGNRKEAGHQKRERKGGDQEIQRDNSVMQSRGRSTMWQRGVKEENWARIKGRKIGRPRNTGSSLCSEAERQQ